MNQPSIIDREREFHNRWATETATEDILIREAFESPTAVENQFILSKMGDLKGLKVLDIGAGLCESSIYFALQGAEVTATDLSPEMLEKGKQLAKKYGCHIETIASNAEELANLPNRWDIIYCANTLHHLHDRDAFLAACHHLLNDGGRLITWDPIAYNPIINIYRRLAMEVRTEDEAPLKVQDLAMIRGKFGKIETRFFWGLTLVLFLKYYLIDRLPPGKTRYWKHIFKETPKTLKWWTPLEKIDRVLTQIPVLRWLTWNVVVIATKSVGDSPPQSAPNAASPS